MYFSYVSTTYKRQSDVLALCGFPMHDRSEKMDVFFLKNMILYDIGKV